MAAPALTHFEKPVNLSVNGVIIDEFGDGLSAIVITIRTGGIIVHNATSDAGGTFEFKSIELDVGIHSVEALARNYSSALENIEVNPDLEGKSLNLSLRLEALTIPGPGIVAGEGESLHVSRSILPEISSSSFYRVRVFFATDRQGGLVQGGDFRSAYGNARALDGKLQFGECEVSIPHRHRIGNLESPSVFKLEFRSDPNKHVALLNLEKLDVEDFFSKVSVAAESAKNSEAFVFVHGYSVTFPEALRRTAQIAFDLRFEGVPICYSWPSLGKYSGYPADEASIEWTEAHLLSFLDQLCTQRRIKSIHLLAHSMGNRALVRILEKIGNRNSSGVPPNVRQTILAAPDIDAGTFEHQAIGAVKAASRLTLYASSSDRPLQWSKDFHKYRRAGDTEQGIVIVPGVDSIDASEVPSGFLGHSYYGDTRTILSDVYQLFMNGSAPPRFGLRPEKEAGKLYWVFVP
jgi:esterase/lipase superfamily enzyme